jgi:hypothetical protein
MPINIQMNKEKTPYANHGIQFSLKKKENSIICNKMDKP